MPRDYQLRVTLLQSPFLRLGIRLQVRHLVPCALLGCHGERLFEEIGFGPRVAGNSNDDSPHERLSSDSSLAFSCNPARLGPTSPPRRDNGTLKRFPKGEFRSQRRPSTKSQRLSLMMRRKPKAQPRLSYARYHCPHCGGPFIFIEWLRPPSSGGICTAGSLKLAPAIATKPSKIDQSEFGKTDSAYR